MIRKNGRMSRRDFLKSLGAFGGSTAVWAGLNAWGMALPSMQQPPPLEGEGNGVSVIILGSGLGGMAAGIELMQQGYDIQILEARDRPGGRNFTARRGTIIDEYGVEEQECQFDEGEYSNLGPWRIPHHHESTLHYCRELNVPMEVFVNYQEGNYVYVEGDHGPLSGRPIRYRELWADMGGYTGELLAKFASQNQLNNELNQEDVDMILDYLAGETLIDRDTLEYTGTGRRGYEIPPGALDQPGQPLQPYTFNEILPYATEIMQAQSTYLGRVAGFSQQMTMFQPVGGMDRIGVAMAEALGNRITYQAEVTQINQNEAGVSIVYENLQTGETQEITADYCICNIPLTVLSRIQANFSQEMAEAIRSVTYTPTGKIGLQFSRRFWEEDEQIYGGSTRTNISEVGDIAYPNYNFFGQKGVIQGYYNFGVNAIETSNLSLQERIEFALEQGSKIHPNYRDYFENAVSLNWHLMPYQLGGWASYTSRTRELYYQTLSEPDGRVYLVGDHLSYLTGWQAGAIESAWKQIESLHERVMQTQGS